MYEPIDGYSRYTDKDAQETRGSRLTNWLLGLLILAIVLLGVEIALLSPPGDKENQDFNGLSKIANKLENLEQDD